MTTGKWKEYSRSKLRKPLPKRNRRLLSTREPKKTQMSLRVQEVSFQRHLRRLPMRRRPRKRPRRKKKRTRPRLKFNTRRPATNAELRTSKKSTIDQRE